MANIFSRFRSGADAGGEAQPEPEPAGKGRPTPSRAEREAERKRPLVPNDRKVAARTSRDKAAADREKARIGMANGDDRYMPAQHKGPQKRYVRDYLDARYSVGELLIPVAVVYLVGSTILPTVLSSYLTIGAIAYFGLATLDAVIVSMRIRRLMIAKWGVEKVPRIGFYTLLRAIYLRPLRVPKPMVKRGEFPS